MTRPAEIIHVTLCTSVPSSTTCSHDWRLILKMTRPAQIIHVTLCTSVPSSTTCSHDWRLILVLKMTRPAQIIHVTLCVPRVLARPVQNSNTQIPASPDLATNLLQILIPTTFDSLLCQKSQFTLQLLPERLYVRKVFSYYPQKVKIENSL